MKYVTSILSSFKERDSYKSFSLQQRLVMFFSLISGCVILTFTLLLVIFDLTGINKKTIYRFMENELSHIMETAQRDFGNISSLGIRLSEDLSASCEDYLTEMGLTAGRLLTSREHMEDFLNSSASSMILLAKQNDCGGIFVILDSQLTDTSADDYGKSGLFFKRTQPLSSPAVSPKLYYLRGAASIAREHKIDLLGQWQMYYRKEELNFFDKVMETSKENNDLPLSKLFYWSQRVLLDGNSEEGLLLCLPIILDDGSLLGVCGLEVSDRMFKQSYSPDESVYPGVFSLLSPRIENEFYAPGGLVAGNRYLTGGYVSSPLISSLEVIRTKGDFSIFQGHTGDYGGLTGDFMLYPAGSPYEDEMWALSILMPDPLFSAETVADTLHLFLIVFSLLILSVLACFIVSRRFLRPIEKGLSSIREMQFESEKGEFGISEIDHLYETIATDLRSHKEEINRLNLEKEQAKTEVSRLAYERKKEIDPQDYEYFMSNINTLTPAELRIFHLYIAGKSTKEVLEELSITENTLKFHNKHIYGKLGVSNRKELLRFITVMDNQ